MRGVTIAKTNSLLARLARGPLLTLLLALAPADASPADRPRVVATTPDLAAIVRAVGGDAVAVTSLARAGEDPHFVDPRPSFVSTLNRADVLVEGGASLESGWLAPLVQNARNARIVPGAPGYVAAATGLTLRDVPASLDRAMGDVHPQGNPHFMLDPVAARQVAANIAAGLCAADHSRCGEHSARLKSFQTDLDARLSAWQARLAPWKGTRIVTYHNGLDYFAARFGLVVAGTLEPKPGIAPPPAHLTGLVATMRAQGVALVVVESYRERRNPDFVAQSSGATLVSLSTMPDGDGANAYTELLEEMIASIVTALERRPK